MTFEVTLIISLLNFGSIVDDPCWGGGKLAPTLKVMM
ncbi:hypothetical protein LMED105_10555 [Limnobacter sp. MED105]|nr:hypothetical protein LMED105_10555 [Limnobacter sp. MED105]